jgi:crossover junction endodeoxyribonuclease RuvC
MIWLGVDPGSRVAGYSLIEVIDRGKLKVLEYGVIKCGTDKDLVKRLSKLVAELDQIFLTYKPEKMVLEDVFFAKNPKSALILGQARGCVLAKAIQYNCEVIGLSPKEIKQAVTGRGGADKETVALMMQKHLGLKEIPKPEDASDALAMAWVGITYKG